MKILRLISRWISLYLLVGIFFVALFWEENLKVNLFFHKIIAIGLLLLFGLLTVRWVDHHKENFLVSQDYRIQDTPQLRNHFEDHNDIPEKQ
jgi:hypothetical protein